jgi:hypothetical protein
MGLIINSYSIEPVETITTGIKFYFHFEESSGNIINAATTGDGFPDGLGSDSNGTKNGNPTYSQTGKIDNAIEYDGGGDYFELGTAVSNFKFLNDGSDFTICFWMKRSDLVNELQGVFGTGEGGTTLGLALRIDGTNNNVRCQIENGSGASTSITSSNGWIPDNTTTWYYYVITFDGSEQIWNIYRNNANNETNTDTVSMNDNNPTNLPQIGSEPDTGGVEDLNGLLDEFVVFNRIITSDERDFLYNGGSGQLIT